MPFTNATDGTSAHVTARTESFSRSSLAVTSFSPTFSSASFTSESTELSSQRTSKVVTPFHSTPRRHTSVISTVTTVTTSVVTSDATHAHNGSSSPPPPPVRLTRANNSHIWIIVGGSAFSLLLLLSLGGRIVWGRYRRARHDNNLGRALGSQPATDIPITYLSRGRELAWDYGNVPSISKEKDRRRAKKEEEEEDVVFDQRGRGWTETTFVEEGVASADEDEVLETAPAVSGLRKAEGTVTVVAPDAAVVVENTGPSATIEASSTMGVGATVEVSADVMAVDTAMETSEGIGELGLENMVVADEASSQRSASELEIGESEPKDIGRRVTSPKNMQLGEDADTGRALTPVHVDEGREERVTSL